MIVDFAPLRINDDHSFYYRLSVKVCGYWAVIGSLSARNDTLFLKDSMYEAAFLSPWCVLKK